MLSCKLTSKVTDNSIKIIHVVFIVVTATDITAVNVRL